MSELEVLDKLKERIKDVFNEVNNLIKKSKKYIDFEGYDNVIKSKIYSLNYDLDVIETALKKLEKPKEIVGTTTISEATKNALLEWCPDIQKKLEALEIIKEKWVQVGAFIEMHNNKKIIEIAKNYRNNYFLYLYNCCFASSYGELTQEEFDLLKEVLL